MLHKLDRNFFWEDDGQFNSCHYFAFFFLALSERKPLQGLFRLLPFVPSSLHMEGCAHYMMWHHCMVAPDSVWSYSMVFRSHLKGTKGSWHYQSFCYAYELYFLAINLEALIFTILKSVLLCPNILHCIKFQLREASIQCFILPYFVAEWHWRALRSIATKRFIM